MKVERLVMLTIDNLDKLNEAENEATIRNKRKISFGLRTTRVYNQIIDSHPCVRRGAGLGIGWDYNVSDICLIDDYEKQFQEKVPKEERRQKCPRIEPKERESILFKLGYTAEDIHDCVCEIHDIKDDRLETAFEDSFEETSEDEDVSVIRTCPRIDGFRLLPRSHSDPLLQTSKSKSLLTKNRRNSLTTVESITETPKKSKNFDRFGFLNRSQSEPLLQRRRSCLDDSSKDKKRERFSSISMPKLYNLLPSFAGKKNSMKIPKYMRSPISKNKERKSPLLNQ